MELFNRRDMGPAERRPCMDAELHRKKDDWPARLWNCCRPAAAPALFFLAVLYYEELFLKLYCFRGLTLAGTAFTFVFSIPVAMVVGLICGALRPSRARWLLAGLIALLSVWMGTQCIYYRMFKTFVTLFSLTKMGMVAGGFGDMVLGEILLNWFPVLMMALPAFAALYLAYKGRWLVDGPISRKMRGRWLLLALGIQGAGMLTVLMCGSGTLSLRDIYYQAAVPELEVQNFGMMTQTQLEIRRVVFGIDPDREVPPKLELDQPRRYLLLEEHPEEEPQILEIDFSALMERDGEDEQLVEMHKYFSQVEPTAKNEWTGRFQGKNLVWIVAEGYSSLILDPERTPTLWKLSHEGIVCSNFYTPLWGVSTSDGEYVTTTGLIPKSGVWSYSESSDNAMPFSLGNQFRALGYKTMAFHDYLYTYYDRNLSHPNMGYDYYGIGNGLELEEVFPPSDLEMMEEIVPRFVNEEQFMVYCLTVSGHLNYTYDDNAMSRRHWDEVADLDYSDPVKAYLACQMELELAVTSLMEQLEAAGKLEDTVIVLSADHYPYGLTDEEYSELLGHEVDPVFEIFENGLILWSADLTEPVYVDKYCSSLDVMPTLSNLFGLPYDSRLMAGRDILSDSPGLVIFSNYSFLTDQGAYNSIDDTFAMWDGSQPNEEYVTQCIAEVQNRVAYSAMILDRDYYRVVFSGSEEPDA